MWTEGTWASDVDTDTWTDVHPEVAPPPINYFAFAADEESDRAVLFGLRPGGESLLWAYDYETNTWEELERTDRDGGGHELGPPQRRRAGLAPNRS